MIVRQFVEGFIANNNYLLIDEESKEAALIDCTDYISELGSVLKEYNAKLKYILLTHGHFDHIMRASEIREITGAKIAIHCLDDEFTEKADLNMSLAVTKKAMAPYKPDILLKDNDILLLEDNIIKCIHTPGHTPGSVCYIVENMIFSGDTIFKEDIGITSLETGNSSDMEKSLKRILNLKEDYTIYPGHNEQTTLLHEIKYNKHLINLKKEGLH